MRIIVPLQGLVQGRSGLALGVIIPLLSFYFIQLRPKRSQQQQQQQQRLNTTTAAATAAAAELLPPTVNSKDSSSETEAATPSETALKEQQHLLLPPPPQTTQQHLEEEEADSSSTATFVTPAAAAISERALWILRSCDSSAADWTAAIPVETAYDQMHNPAGRIQLAVAINKLSLDLIQDWLCDHLSNAPGHETFPNLEEAADYESQRGLQRVRTVLANFMGTVMGGGERVTFDPANVIVTAGRSAAIEMLAFCIAQPGDAILIPTPYDSGFDKDIKWRAQVEIIPVPCYAHNDFSVTRGDLEIAYHSALQRGTTVRAVLLSTPSYPVGNVLDRATLRSILAFVHENSLHLISDEVYAGCVFEGGSSTEFASIAEVVESSECDRSQVHVVYGLSKDLGVAGFQGLLVPLLADEGFVETFLAENRRRITQRYRKVIAALDVAGIKCAKSSGGLCCWLFLGHCLRSSSQEEEIKLCRYVSDEMGLHLMPGSAAYSCHEPGWFGLCFASVDERTLNIALERLLKLGPGGGVQY